MACATSDVFDGVEFKPVASEFDLISGCLAVSDAIYVALDDLLADLTNITTHFATVIADNRVFEEKKGNQILVMEHILQLTAAAASDTFNYPAGISTEAMKREYYEKVSRLYDLELELHNSINTRQYGQIDQAPVRQLTNEIEQEYNAKPNMEALRPWVLRKKYREVVDWKQAQQEYDEIKTELEKRFEHQQAAARDLQHCLIRLGNDPKACFVDNQCQRDQTYLHFFMANIIEVISQNITEEMAQWIRDEFESPTSLVALTLSGFDLELHQVIGKAFQAEDSNQILKYSDLGNWIARRNDIVNFIEHPEIQHSPFWSKISTTLQKVMTAFTAAISVPANILARQVASMSSVVAYLSPAFTINHPDATQAYQWRRLLAERYATNVGLKGITKKPLLRYRCW